MKRLSLLLGCVLAMALPRPVFANSILFDAVLNGPSEFPPNFSPAVGFATVTIDLTAQTMEVDVTFSGLLAPNTASHIHCCTAVPGTGTAGVATVTPTFTGFPTGANFGTYDHIFDMSDPLSYNASFIASHGGTVPAAFAALVAGMESGEAYLNIHSTLFAGGEIRGFLESVPEPSTIALLAIGLAGLVARRKLLP